MAATDPARRRTSAIIAARSRHRGSDDPQATALRAELAVDRLAEHIRAVVDTAPPLTEQALAPVYALLDAAPRARALT